MQVGSVNPCDHHAWHARVLCIVITPAHACDCMYGRATWFMACRRPVRDHSSSAGVPPPATYPGRVPADHGCCIGVGHLIPFASKWCDSGECPSSGCLFRSLRHANEPARRRGVSPARRALRNFRSFARLVCVFRAGTTLTITRTHTCTRGYLLTRRKGVPRLYGS